MSKSRRVSILQEYTPFLIGLTTRLLIATILPPLLDSTPVPYTDIDYHVYSDAAQHIRNGGSPYDRHTYRYTPFLAGLLSWIGGGDDIDGGDDVNGGSRREWGRILFCVADAVCGQLILSMRRTARRTATTTSTTTTTTTTTTIPSTRKKWSQRADAIWWLYNPLPINICTRGSCESLLVLLPILLAVHTAQGANGRSNNTRNNNDEHALYVYGRPITVGVLIGTAIHTRLYPAIYIPCFMAHFALSTTNTNPHQHPHPEPKAWDGTRPYPIGQFIWIWFKRVFLRPAPLLFFATTLGTFVGVTYLGVILYGRIALEEGLLYHFGRIDHRHNYSLHWYWIYLGRAQAQTVVDGVRYGSDIAGVLDAGFLVDDLFLQRLGTVLFIPQALLLFLTSIAFPKSLPLAMFLQTFSFVTFNKVVTAQYFTWYLVLLPLAPIHWNVRMLPSALVLGASVVCWLLSAYTLEMRGWSSHFMVWMGSCGFFVGNVLFLKCVLRNIEPVDVPAKAKLK